MWVIVAPRFLKFWTRGFARAMALWPFVLIEKSEDKLNQKLMRHEQIHMYQQLELLLIFFYLWYAFEYLIYRLRRMPHDEAYLNISFEKEARWHEHDLQRKRKVFGFLQFI